MLARHIAAKHPWTKSTLQKIVGHYSNLGKIGALTAGSLLPKMTACPLWWLWIAGGLDLSGA